jgi:hypothetical protein
VPFGVLNLAGPSPGSATIMATGWTAGLGDLGVAVKHALVQSARSGSILALGLDVSFPTGRSDRGLGAGATVLDPFAAYGQILPAGAFVQVHAGADLPVGDDAANPDVFWRAALGWSYSHRRFGRMFSPMVEVLGERALDAAGAVATWDLAPEFQVTLSRRKHVRLDVGARVPIVHKEDRQAQLGAYLLWDWYEGSPFGGW